LCDWAVLAPAVDAAGREARSDASGCIVPFDLLIVSAITPADQRDAAAKFGAHVHHAALASVPIVSRGAQPRQRLRIGYISSDFSNHATTILLGGVLEAHDKSGFAISGFSTGPPAFDGGRRRVEQACERFFDLHGMTDEAAARLIARERIDILVDLKGHTKECRLNIQARRPAPLVVSWLGYPGTLGVPRLADYLIGDPIVTPLDRARDYSETLALLPHCYQPNDCSRAVGPRPRRDEVGLPGDAVVLCCFNRSHKITPDAFALWMRLLNEAPDAVLWLYEDNGSAVRNLRAAALRSGVPDHRIIFASPAPSADHLARIQCADLAIDTFPYTSHTTGSDALWAGVPLATRIGETFASRVAASLLHNVGLPELVADDEAAYLALLTDLARDRGRRSALREKLAANRLTAPLFDTRTFARDLERLYRAIWDQECRGQRAPVALEPL
jgi:predicted O-linked N-acetylglucosamine transferase (SPINDLY family)